MGMALEAHKLAEAELKKSRAKMEKDNLAQMEALAKIQPTPTIAELQAAMGMPVEPADVAPPDHAPPAQVVQEKTSGPEHVTDKGSYKTRASQAKKADE